MTLSTYNAGYEIFMYDHTGALQIVLGGWEYLEFSQRVNSPWNYIIRIEHSYLDDQVDFLRNTLVRDWIVEVYKSDEVTGVRRLVFEGFHRTIVEQVRQSGTIIFTLYGTGYTQLLKRRIVIPVAGQDNLNYSGAAETVLKNFVDSQIINPVDTTRIFLGFTNETDLGVGGAAEYSARYTNLFTVCTNVAEEGDVDFGVIGGNTQGEFIFSVRELWGTDRSVGNAGGYPPVIFDLFLHNMDIPIRSLSSSDEINHIYIGGQDAGAARTILEMSTTDESVSPWNRIEEFVDARQESTVAGLTTVGQNYLNKYAVRDTLSFNLLQSEGTRWLRDWFLGDIITSRYFDLTFTHQIVEVRVVVSSGETGASQIETINAEMETII